MLVNIQFSELRTSLQQHPYFLIIFIDIEIQVFVIILIYSEDNLLFV